VLSAALRAQIEETAKLNKLILDYLEDIGYGE